MNNGSLDEEELEETIENLMLKIEGGYSCTKCEKQTLGTKNARSHMKSHIEGKHIAGLKLKCPHCGRKCSSRKSVKSHVKRFHEE